MFIILKFKKLYEKIEMGYQLWHTPRDMAKQENLNNYRKGTIISKVAPHQHVEHILIIAVFLN